MAIVKRIAHIDMDAFFVSVELRDRPELRGLPVVVGGTGGRGVVTSASYEARRYGIRSGMPTARARQLCPDAVFLSGSGGKYGEVSRQIQHILADYSPDVDFTYVDEGYIDLTGTERIFGPVIETCRRIREEVLAATGCSASIGIAGNRLCAKVACKSVKPSGLIEVLPGCEDKFLAPLPVTLLPGAGGKLGKRLELFGITRVGQLADAGEEILRKTFGAGGVDLFLKSRGVAVQRRRTYAAIPRKSVGHDRTFAEDTTDFSFLERVIFRLCERCCRTLRDEGLVCRCVTVKVRLADFRTFTRSRTLLGSTDNDMEVFGTARSILRAFEMPRVAVRMAGVSLSSLSAECQWGLFNQAARFYKLYQSIDRLRDKYGFGSIVSGLVLGDETTERYGGGRKRFGQY